MVFQTSQLQDEVWVVVDLLIRVSLFCTPMDCSPPEHVCPWNSPGKNTSAGCHFLLQGIFPIQRSNRQLLHWQAGSLPLSHLESMECQILDTNLWWCHHQLINVSWVFTWCVKDNIWKWFYMLLSSHFLALFFPGFIWNQIQWLVKPISLAFTNQGCFKTCMSYDYMSSKRHVA